MKSEERDARGFDRERRAGACAPDAALAIGVWRKPDGVGAPRERLTSGACTVCPDGWDATPTANFVRCRAPEGTPPLACGRDVTFKDGPTGLRNWAKAFGVPWAEPCDLSHPEQYLRKN